MIHIRVALYIGQLLCQLGFVGASLLYSLRPLGRLGLNLCTFYLAARIANGEKDEQADQCGKKKSQITLMQLQVFD